MQLGMLLQQTYLPIQLPDATADDTSLYQSAVSKKYWRELQHVEKPAKAHNSLPG
jgi:hypothetical protein